MITLYVYLCLTLMLVDIESQEMTNVFFRCTCVKTTVGAVCLCCLYCFYMVYRDLFTSHFVLVFRIRSDGSSLIQDRKYHLKTYKQCFVAKDFVDWLLARGEATTRSDAVTLGKQLVDAGVICHGEITSPNYMYFEITI